MQDFAQQQLHCRQLEASLLESHKASTQSLAALAAATQDHTALHAQITDLRVKVSASNLLDLVLQSLAALVAATQDHTALHAQITDLCVKVGALNLAVSDLGG